MNTFIHLAILVAALVLPAHSLCAQEVKYDLTGTYSTDQAAPPTNLAGPGGAFKFEFVVPERVAIDGSAQQPYFINTPIISGFYLFGGTTVTSDGGSYQYSESGFNRTSLLFNTPVGTIDLEAFGQGAGNLRPLALPNSNYSQAEFQTGDLGLGAARYVAFSLIGGTNTSFAIENSVSVVGTTVPEPSTAAYLAVGVVALVGVTQLCRRKLPGWRKDRRR